jgi:hypothetical protein
MPDDNPSQGIQNQRDDGGTNPKVVGTPLPPYQPNPADAKSIAERQMQTDVEALTDRVKRAEKWMIGLTGAIALFALCSVVVALLQWRSSENQGIDAHKLAVAASNQSDAASDMATAAGDQVDAGNNFADTAEDINRGVAKAAAQLQASAENSKQWTKTVQGSLRLDQRAWISIWVTGQAIEVSKPASASLRIQNIGRTPAKKISALAKLERVAGDKQPDFTYNQQFIKGQPVTGDLHLAILLPNAQANLTLPEVIGVENGKTIGQVILDQESLDAISAGTIKLFLHGELKYSDMFNINHWVKFCFQYAPGHVQSSSPTDGSSSFVACQTHYETDE